MKKSLVAVSIIAVLGAAWTGASWYTGKLIEKKMGDAVEQVSAQIKHYLPHAGIKLVYQDYQRGMFRSKFRYLLQSDGTAVGDAILKPGEEIVLLETIDHGPFPLAQMKKFNFIPSMASVHTELDNTPALKKLFEITQGKSLVTADSRISYGGDTSSAIKIVPVEYQQGDTTLKFAGATLGADIANDMSKVKLEGKSQNLVISMKNLTGRIDEITLQGITASSVTHRGKFDLDIGEQQLGIKQVVFSQEGKDTTTLEGTHLGVNSGETDNGLNSQLTYSIDAVKYQGNDFGSGKLAINFDKLDGQALKQFSSSAVQDDKEHVDLLVQTLLKGNPSVSIAPLSWKNSKGEGVFTLNLDLAAPARAATSEEFQIQSMLESVKNMEATLTVPLAMASELVAQIDKLSNKYSAEESQKRAGQKVQNLAKMGQMLKLITTKDDVISSSFRYTNNQIELNGQKVPWQELIGLFGIGSSDSEQPKLAEPVAPPSE